jgi:hypothetical protein
VQLRKEVDNKDKHKWQEEFPSIYLGDNFPLIPIRFTKERITASAEGKERVMTHAVMVSTPTKYGKMMKTLLSIAVIKKKITNLIPFALGKEDKIGSWQHKQDLWRTTGTFLFSTCPTMPRRGWESKEKVCFTCSLETSNQIQRMAYDTKTKQYHVSTRSNFYRETHQWIMSALEEHKFDFKPSIRKMRFEYLLNGSKASVYSNVFKDAISAALEYHDGSTIKTPRSNAWHQRPPLAISYVKGDEAFPHLPPKAQQHS